MTSLTVSAKRKVEGKKSVSSRKEKNVTLKEKHLHAKTQALFQLRFTNFLQKSIHIKCYYLKKRKNLCKNVFFKES
jgi:hypothetical protein